MFVCHIILGLIVLVFVCNQPLPITFEIGQEDPELAVSLYGTIPIRFSSHTICLQVAINITLGSQLFPPISLGCASNHK